MARRPRRDRRLTAGSARPPRLSSSGVAGDARPRQRAPGAQPPSPRAVIIARGARVHLRTLLPRDLAQFSRWVDNPYLSRMVGSEFLDAFKHVYDESPAFHDAVLTDPTQVVFMIEAREGRTAPVGLVRLFNIHLREGYAFLETIIAERRDMRWGFGVEAGRLIAYYGVDVLGLRRIEAKVYEYNRLSVNALRRNGFRQEGILRQAGFDGERSWDVLVFGVLRDEIEAQRRHDTVDFPFEPEGNGPDPA